MILRVLMILKRMSSKFYKLYLLQLSDDAVGIDFPSRSGASHGTRTRDLLITNELLYQLS